MSRPHPFIGSIAGAAFTRLVILSLVLMVFGAAPEAVAQRIWDGGSGADSNWGTAANWDAALVPGNTLTFGGVTRLTPNNNTTANTTYGSITFNNTAGAFTLTGNAIDLVANGTVTNNSSNAQIVNLPIRLEGDGAVTSNGGQLTIQGAISEDGNNAKVLTFDGAGNILVSGSITESSPGSRTDLGITKNGLGTLTLTNNGNNYESGTIINGGILAVGENGNLGATSGSVSFTNGATLRSLAGGSSTLNLGARAINLGAGGATLDASGKPIYLGGPISGGGGLVTGGNDVILNRASGNNNIGAITVDSGRLFVQNQLANINGSTILVKSGAILDIEVTGANTLTNAVTIESGGGLNNRLGTLTVSRTNLILPTAGFVVFNNDDQATTAITITGNNPALTGDLTIQVGGNNATVGAVTFNGAFSGNFGITKTSTGTLNLNAANTHSGATLVSGGTLGLGNLNALQNSTLNTGTSGTQQVTFNVGGTNTYNLGGLAGADNLAIGANRISVGANNEATTYSGVVSGTGGLTKVGTNTLTLSGNNDYKGVTTVSNGTLLINGIQSAATGDLNVASGATLGGNGTVGGKTFINGGTHKPGSNAPGVMTHLGDLSYGSNSTVQWELTSHTSGNGPSPFFDQIVVKGNLNFTGATTLNLTFNSAGSTVDWSDPFWDMVTVKDWLIYEVSGTTTGFSNLSLNAPANWNDGVGGETFPAEIGNNLPSNANFYLYQSGSNIYLRYEAIPEPAGFALLALAMGLVTMMARPRRRLVVA